MSTDLKLSKFSLSLSSKIVGPLMKIAIPLAKNVPAPLGITAAASGMLLGTLGASLLGNLLTRKGILRAGSGKERDF